jgi:hypothetical protein
MDADERDICIYLKSWHGQFISGREVNRRASGKRRFREDPNWATPVLGRLVEKGVVESDTTGHFRLRPRPQKDKSKKWVSPHIKKILQDSGKDFDHVIEADGEDEEF